MADVTVWGLLCGYCAIHPERCYTCVMELNTTKETEMSASSTLSEDGIYEWTGTEWIVRAEASS